MMSVNNPLLDAEKLSYLLVDTYWQVSIHDELDSTQNFIKEKNCSHGEVVAAEYQSSGRGRLDRSFKAEKSSSLLFSLYIEPKKNRENWGWIPLIAGLSVVNVLNSVKSRFATKWPNDILYCEDEKIKKVCGILIEAHKKGVIVGIGLNVAMTEAQLPVPTATSLALIGLGELDRNHYLVEILREFANLLKRWEAGEDLALEYAETSSTIGKKVEIQGMGGKNVSGLATGIGPNGELVLDGVQNIYSGDVIHLYT
jgi:BirA family biotin operon repressor/biotin-[acetyl-CoA-carboxylase] ligase